MRNKLLLFLMLCNLGVKAGGDDKITTLEYIEKYREIAIEEMKTYGIPASITLAQGILESASGNSYLAREANNHFGIKCHLDWSGKKVYKDDDAKNECFRAYKKAEDSYRDHSLFLKDRSRYAFLFEESPTDYKAWAKGLKKAGYATNRKYPDLIIGLIERYELHKYDLEGFGVDTEKLAADNGEEEGLAMMQIQVSTNRIKFIVAKEGDSFEKIAANVDKKVEDILKYNELAYDSKLKDGQIIYLQPKRRKAARDFPLYSVMAGDSMYSIAQKFGIKLKYLYRKNNMKVGEQAYPGQVLKLR